MCVSVLVLFAFMCVLCVHVWFLCVVCDVCICMYMCCVGLVNVYVVSLSNIWRPFTLHCQAAANQKIPLAHHYTSSNNSSSFQNNRNCNHSDSCHGKCMSYHQIILGTIHYLPHLKLSSNMVTNELWLVSADISQLHQQIGCRLMWEVRMQVHELSQELYRCYQMTPWILWITLSLDGWVYDYSTPAEQVLCI